jgi:regulator of sigma E protease
MVGVGENLSGVVGFVEEGGPAAAAGIRPGDEIVAIDGEAVPTWTKVQTHILLNPDRDLVLKVRRGKEELAVPVHTQAVSKEKVGSIGIEPLVRLGLVTAGEPAHAAGIRVDDAILRIDDTPIRTFNDVVSIVTSSGGKPLRIQLWRAGQILEVEVTPKGSGQGARIGIGSRTVIQKFGPIDAVRQAAQWTWEMTVQTFQVLKGLVTLRLSPKMLSGPLQIAAASGEAARAGPEALFFLVAIISLQVGILNLVPLAPLDGGHMAIIATEAVVRHDLSMTAKIWIMNAGAAMIFLLIGFVLYSDLSKTSLFGKFLP